MAKECANLTARGLISLALKRWYLMALGAMLSVGALYLTTHQPGVYYTQFDVVLLAPIETYYQNKIEDPRYAMAPMAGVLATEWSHTQTPLFTASGDTTLFGEGQRQGIQVRVSNQGTQWQPAYYSPNINVQIVDISAQAVEVDARRVTAELEALLVTRQDWAGVRPSMRMTTITSPTVPNIDYIAGKRTRAALASGLVGATTTTVAVYWIDRLMVWRRSQRKAPVANSAPVNEAA